MDKTTPRIVIEGLDEDQHSVAHSTSFFVRPPPSPGCIRTSPSVVSDSEKKTSDGGTFVKLVNTVKFIKKWTQREEDTAKGREAFLKKFKLSVPNIDSASTVGATPSLQEDQEGETRGNWVPVKRRRISRWLRHLYFNPMNVSLYRWLVVITIAVLYNAYVIIARQTFSQLQDEPWKVGVWLTLDYIADGIYILDMVIQFRTGYFEQGMVITDSRKMALHYITSRAFKFDVISAIPFDWLYAIPKVGVAYTIVRLNRIVRLHRIMQFFYQRESRTNWPNFFRILNLLLYLSLTIHWNACFYFLISMRIGFGSDTWVYPSIEDDNGTLNEFSKLTRQYLVSLYWSTLTLTTIGELPAPVTDVEHLFVIFDFLVGVLIFAVIVGMVGGIITNMNIRKIEFQWRLDNIKQYMRYRDVGKPLQARVIRWFNYLWTNNHSLDEQAILKSLPDKLHAEIAIHVHFETLRKVEIFKECEVGLLEELVLKLRPQVYSPGDYICRKGDIGKEMYIIKNGKLEVVGENGEAFATLSNGSYFGEISVLNLSESGNRRTASVRSVGYSNLFCLSKADLLEVLKEYPEAKAILEERGRRTLMRDRSLENEISQPLPISWQSIPPTDDDHMTRIDELEQNLKQLEKRFNRLLGEYSTAQMKLKQRIHALELLTK